MNRKKNDEAFKVAVYCRVASPNPADQFELDVQERILRDYADEYGYQVMCCLKEGGNGLSLNRPQLNVIREMTGETIDKLLVTNVTRIGRNIMDVDRFIQNLKAKGIEVEAVDRSHKSPSELDELFKSIAEAALERRRAKKDTTSTDMVSLETRGCHSDLNKV